MATPIQVLNAASCSPGSQTASNLRRIVLVLAGLLMIMPAMSVEAAALTNRPMVFRHLGLEDGLSQSTVTAIFQDSAGYLWFSTENGLNRYDGHRIERFMRQQGSDGSLSNDFIWAIAEDRQKNLWLASEGGGLIQWQRATGRFRGVQRLDQGTAAEKLGRSVLIDSRGSIWLGTRGGGLLQFDADGELIRRFVHAPDDPATLADNTVSVIAQWSEDSLIIGTDAGLQSLDLQSGELRRLATPGLSISSLMLDRQRRLWAGSFDQGVLLLSPDLGSHVHLRHQADDSQSLSSDAVRAILQDDDGRIWVATQDGLNLYRPQSGGFQSFRHQDADPYSLANNQLMSLHQSRDGILWVGTRLAGVSRWNPRSWSLGGFSPPEMNNAAVLAFADGLNGSTWIGGFGMPLLQVDRDGIVQKSFRPEHGFPDRGEAPVTALLAAADGQLWIGTMNAGLQVYERENNRLLSLNDASPAALQLGANGVMSLFEDRQGQIWVGTFGGGVSRISQNADRSLKVTRYGAPDEASTRITSISEDQRGQIWLGSDGGGLLRLDPLSGEFSHFRQEPGRPESLGSDTIYSLLCSRDGQLWIGTAGAGLMQLSRDQLESDHPRFRHWGSGQGLSNNVINGIRQDGRGKIWLSSNGGLMRLDPGSREIRYFHRAQGLQSEEFNYGAHHLSADGRLHFGGSGGYNSFDPSVFDAKRPGPRLVLTGIEKFNQPLQTASAYSEIKKLTLEHDADVLTFQYAALDFAAPQRNLYSVKLEGFDRDWSPPSHRNRSTYTNLDPGHYVFRVRGANSDGFWNPSSLDLAIVIKPAPWATPLAYVLYAAVLLGLFAAFMRWRLRGLEREARIRQLAFYDRVTGLPNRDMFSSRLAEAVSRAQREGATVSVICLRLGSLKRLQDSLGTQSMDDVLRTLSPRMTQQLFGHGPTHSSRDLARLSENEFIAFIQLENAQTQASLWARRLCETISKPIHFDEHQIKVSAYAGIASYPADGEPAALIEFASTAARDAAKGSGSGFAFYAEDMTRRAIDRLKLESQLRTAIKDNELELYLQGKFDCTGRLVGAEALSRWMHPDRGPVSPGVFVPLAEETDLIMELDDWVIGRACEALQDWDEKDYQPISIAVNVSAETFTSGRIFSALENHGRRCKIDPARLEIEITETVLASDLELITRSLKRIKSLGHILSLDDFGTGYSSLTYLQRFPIDKLKIDQAFIRDLEHKPDQQALCTAVIALARSLNLKTIAEGVENQAQQDLLCNLGCDQLQGFFLHRPQAISAFEIALLEPDGIL